MKNPAFRAPHPALGSWLPDMDLNHDKQIQSLLCYRYTIGHAVASESLNGFPGQSRPVKPLNRCTAAPCRAEREADSSVQRSNDSTIHRN
jgi:hypothetical protein